MSQISIQNLTFCYDGACNNVFENLNLNLDTDWKLGLIGRNGRGKTTFLNLLLGKLKYKGKISSGVSFDYFPYQINDKQKSVIDLLPSINPDYDLWEIMKKMEELDLCEDCLYMPYEILSNGQQTKLMLAILFSKENNFLLIDEPTNHLDNCSRTCVKNFLNNQTGFIVVSHDRDFIDSCVDHIISINKNNIEIQKGNFSSWWQNKLNKDNFELMQNQKMKKEISRLQESAKQTKNWSDKVEKTKIGIRIAGLKPDKGAIGHKAAKMAKRSKVIELRQNKAIEEKSKLLKNIERQEDLFFNSQTFKSEKVLEVKNLTIEFDKKIIINNVSFSVEKGDRLAICGNNGSGKTSLLKSIIENNKSCSGVIYKCRGLKISYISQKFDFKDQTITDFAKNNNLFLSKFFTLLIKLGFNSSQFEDNINNLSDGQKKKILIAKSLCEEANLYIWDEPLNFIDVISRIQIEQLLLQTNITLIFVEHDSAFVRNISTKVLNL